MLYVRRDEHTIPAVLPYFIYQFISFTICNLTCSIWLRRWRKHLKAYCFAISYLFRDTSF